MKRHAAATTRNRQAILACLQQVLPSTGVVLEVASGSGEHAVWFARHLSTLTWQPSDPDPGALASIAAWSLEAALPNLLPALALDAAAPNWPVTRADAIVCINMVHIAPWDAAIGLFAGGQRILPAGGVLCTYGPYRFAGEFTAPSNAAFDESLRHRDSAWGVRDVNDLEALANEHQFCLSDVIAMPANNHVLVFRR